MENKKHDYTITKNLNFTSYNEPIIVWNNWLSIVFYSNKHLGYFRV